MAHGVASHSESKKQSEKGVMAQLEVEVISAREEMIIMKFNPGAQRG